MRATEIIKEIERLPIARRIFIVEMALKSIRSGEEKPLVLSDEDRLQMAANALQQDYSTDKELTAFTAIDFDKFYEAR
jgi:hypothetical protein